MKRIPSGASLPFNRKGYHMRRKAPGFIHGNIRLALRVKSLYRSCFQRANTGGVRVALTEDAIDVHAWSIIMRSSPVIFNLGLQAAFLMLKSPSPQMIYLLRDLISSGKTFLGFSQV